MNVHSRTPTLSANDPRGLPARTVDYWRAEVVEPVQTRVNRTLHDAAGRAIAQWDPRLWALQMSDPLTPANLTSVYSLNGQVLRSDSVDAGMQVALHGVGAQVLFDWDSRGTRREIQHDPLLRPLAVFEEGESQSRRCVERFMYGQPDAGDPTRNQLGQLIRHDDPAGSVLFETFAITGQSSENIRHFTQDSVTPDWPEPIDQRTRLLEPGEGATSQWRFGPLGQVIEQVDARGNRQGSDFTLDGRLCASHLQLKDQSEARVLVSDIGYNADGQVMQELAGNGVRTTLTYRPEDGRLQERRAKKDGGEDLQRLSYEYDRMGNVLSIEDQALPIRYFANQRIDPISRFTYDSLYQLSEATGWEAGAATQGPESLDRNHPAALSNYRQSYRYDESGNLLELTHVGARSGRKLKAARFSNRCLPYRDDVPPTEEEIAAAFDPRGNLRALEAGRSLTWNLRNQLQSVTPVERASGLNDLEQYVYDGDEQRVRKTRSSRTNARGIVDEVRYLPGLELRDDTATGRQLHVIIAGGGLNSVRVLHWQSPPPHGSNDHYRYTITDHLGSTSLELAEDGRIVSQEIFHPFGETAWSKDTEVSYKTIRYSGKERDATGVYYYGYRYYDPRLQRWLNPDPAGAIDGHNRYRAMRNNPVIYRDSDGRKPNKPTSDRVYHELADNNLVHPVQASGMQPVRRYFENDPNPSVQAYRREIPKALAELGAKDNSFSNTHQAHVIASARTNTASPSGAVLYHSGELVSAAMNRVVGEEITSQLMGPMSVAFNSPVEDPKVLAARRSAVAQGMKIGGKLFMNAKNPAVQLIGAAGVAMGRTMEISEAQTRVQHKMLSAPVSPILSSAERAPPTAFQSFQQTFSAPQQSLFTEPAAPSALAQQLYTAAFTTASPQVVHAADDSKSEGEVTGYPRRNSTYG